MLLFGLTDLLGKLWWLAGPGPPVQKAGAVSPKGWGRAMISFNFFNLKKFGLF